MTAIQDLVLTLCPKMRCVPGTKKIEILDVCIKQGIKTEKYRGCPFSIF